MKKNFVLGMLLGASIIVVIVIALGAIYDCNETLAKLIWPESRKFREIPIHKESIFDDEIVGSIPQSYMDQIHVCEIWETADKEYADPSMVSGVFVYDFDIDRWIYCQ